MHGWEYKRHMPVHTCNGIQRVNIFVFSFHRIMFNTSVFKTAISVLRCETCRPWLSVVEK